MGLTIGLWLLLKLSGLKHLLSSTNLLHYSAVQGQKLVSHPHPPLQYFVPIPTCL